MELHRGQLALAAGGVSGGELAGDGDESDDGLMLLARGGVEGALDALIERHQARVLRLASRYVGDAMLAADVAQNTFVALFRSAPQYQARGKFKAYLYRLLLNQCRMARRSARSHVRVLSDLRESGVGSEQVLQRERQRDLEQAVARLSVKLRDVVVLRFCAELSYDEIAETLDIPTGTVKRRLFDAMAKLRDELGEP
ncbi:MAG TPA: sigma-70 family RNA polymerase sigma factor [Polyangiaceae bacterium]